MRFVILGAGGVGGYFGAKLARAGEDVTYLARGAHLEAIRARGLIVRSSIEGESVAKVSAVDDLKGQAPADVVMLTVKASDTDAVLARARPVVGANTVVLPLQNGVGSPAAIERFYGAGRALGGSAYVFAVIQEPGVIAHHFLGKITFGELDGSRSPRAERLHAALSGAGVPTDLTTEIRRVMWEKYLLICAQAGMTSLTRVPTRGLKAHEPTWAMYRAIIDEVAAVGRAEGVVFARDVVDTIWAMAGGMNPEGRSSMAHDLATGKPLELEALHGHVVRLGRQHGVPTPMNGAVYAALLPHATGAFA
jgi:2-dehydropantoate 2-reductase